MRALHERPAKLQQMFPVQNSENVALDWYSGALLKGWQDESGQHIDIPQQELRMNHPGCEEGGKTHTACKKPDELGTGGMPPGGPGEKGSSESMNRLRLSSELARPFAMNGPLAWLPKSGERGVFCPPLLGLCTLSSEEVCCLLLNLKIPAMFWDPALHVMPQLGSSMKPHDDRGGKVTANLLGFLPRASCP